MLRIAFALGLLGLLVVGPSPAAASPRAATWWFWLSKPERHGSRKLAGDFRPVYGTYRTHSHDRAASRTLPGNFKPNYATYRNHSRERRGLFSFLHFRRRRHEALSHRRRASSPRGGGARRSRMTL